MRIISGKFKGKKILEPLDKHTRPLKDLAKESIFNIIKHSNKLSFDLENSNILDLFSGVGSFGLEALSRNANYVTFIENYPDAVKVLKKNIESLDLNQKSQVIERDVFNELDFEKINKKYDLIFLDPPFKEEKITSLVLKIYNSKVLKSSGVIIMHRSSKEDSVIPNELNILEKKVYGVSQIFFCNFD